MKIVTLGTFASLTNIAAANKLKVHSPVSEDHVHDDVSIKKPELIRSHESGYENNLTNENLRALTSPCGESQKVADAIDCVAKYSKEDICDWSHWTEMYITCDLPGAKIDNFLLPIVKAGQCMWSRWTYEIYTPLYEDYCKITEERPYIHIPNTYCEYYEQGGDGPCESGRSFDDVWRQCEDDGDNCMGVMWNSCSGPTYDITVNGAWKLMSAGQEVGDANNPTETCGGKDQALGHWDVFARKDMMPAIPPSSYIHIPNTYCEYYEQGGDGPCESGRSFGDVWRQCEDDGDNCMGVMWNSCSGPTSDITVNGAWKLMSAGQEVGDANNPTETCGGKDQALGHWDVFARKDTNNSGNNGLNHCEILRLELIAGCTNLATSSLFGAIAFLGCMGAASNTWHKCFENMDRKLAVEDYSSESNFDHLCGAQCMSMLQNVDYPEAGAYELYGMSKEEMQLMFDEGMAYGDDLAAQLEARQ